MFKKIIILFPLLLVLNSNTCFAQWLKYDNILSACVGYSWGPNVTVDSYPILGPQHSITIGGKLFGIMIQDDIMIDSNSGSDPTAMLLKIGAGARHEFGKQTKQAIAFTPYLGYAWYNSSNNIGYTTFNRNEFTSFVFGTRISYYKKILELNLDVSNRNVGISIGIGIW